MLKTILDCMSQLFFRPQYVWFPSHLYSGVIPNASGQSAEFNCLYYSIRVNQDSQQILLHR